MIEEHGEPLGHGIVPQPAGLEWKLRISGGEVKGVAVLVPERLVIGVTATGPQDQVDLFGDANRGAEGAGLLPGPFLGVELDPAILQLIEADLPGLPAGDFYQ